MIPPKIGEIPHFKEVAHRDKIKGKYWENSTASTMKNLHLVVLEAFRSRRFLSSLGKISLYGLVQVSKKKVCYKHEASIMQPTINSSFQCQGHADLKIRF